MSPWVLSEPVPILMGNPRIDLVWVWVWGIPDFFNWVWGCTYPPRHRPHTRHNTRPRHILVPV